VLSAFLGAQTDRELRDEWEQHGTWSEYYDAALSQVDGLLPSPGASVSRTRATLRPAAHRYAGIHNGRKARPAADRLDDTPWRLSASDTTALATATAAYRSGAVTVTMLLTLSARCALMMLADLPHAARSAAEVREWAKAQGIDVKDRGRVPAELVAKFKAATEKQGPARSRRRGYVLHAYAE
jgi:Lsr2